MRTRALTTTSTSPSTSISPLAAQDAVYQWRYTPWLRGGQPVEATKSIPIRFSLPGSDGQFHPYVAPKGVPIPAWELAALLVRSFPAKLPKQAKQQGVSGPVKLRITIDDTGAIVDLGVISGPELLEDAALETVRHWTYHPYLQNGAFTAASSEITVDF